MSKLKVAMLLIFILLHTVSAQKAENPPLQSNNPTFFEKSDLMLIGVFYYPEQWPREQWERDFTNMAKFGFEFTHLAEFAWSLLEPEEGKFNFKWLDEAIDLANKAGLKVILCTPSLCPPAWMGEKYPEIYLVDATGLRREHGVRANASLANPKYQFFVNRIVTQLGQRYGKDHRIIGWQLDNEPLATKDYSASARKAFQTWLKRKYTNIDRLNEIWVGSFWSTKYDNFEQILIPNEEMNSEDKLSPHALLDFQRFTAAVTGEFLNRQADILREFILPNQWITTNYTNETTSSDPRLSKRLDFQSFTMYPVSGRNELGGNNFRTGNPYRIYEACDYFRPIHGTTGLMELQPGQVNWAAINPQLQPGTVRMWITQAFGGGCAFVCTYRYRHPLRSSEMYHEGIVGNDGITLSQGGKEFVQSIQDIKTLRKFYRPNEAPPEKLLKRRTAFLWSHEVMWDLDLQKQTSLWNTWRYRNTITSIIKSAGAPLDFISEQDDFSKYPFLIAPAYQLVDEKLIEKWKNYALNGGNLILTCRTAQKNKDSHFFESGWAAPIASLINAQIEFFDMLIPEVTGTVKTQNNAYTWNCWADILTPNNSAEVLAVYDDQYYKGKAAVVSRKLGKGTVTYIGVYSKDGLLEKEIIRDVYIKAGVEIVELPRGVYKEWRDGFYVAVNYSNAAYLIPDIENARIIIGENPLKPTNSLVWKDNR